MAGYEQFRGAPLVMTGMIAIVPAIFFGRHFVLKKLRLG
jgi:hypothetical protein